MHGRKTEQGPTTRGARIVATVALLIGCAFAVWLGAAATTNVLASNREFIREPNIDRSGNDIRSLKLPVEAAVEDCEKLCRDEASCLAYTFVKRSTTVPQPICWLKNATPYGHQSSCCTSGVLKK